MKDPCNLIKSLEAEATAETSDNFLSSPLAAKDMSWNFTVEAEMMYI